ncbi:MAG: alkaline phosphatase family protein [Planctomycetaceae bacterium]
MSVVVFGGGCSPGVGSREQNIRGQSADQDAIVVPGNQVWTNTGVKLLAGKPVTLTASGQIQLGHEDECLCHQGTRDIEPMGTYFFGSDAELRAFPLPTAGKGPTPAFALIGRIGDGKPFYIGKSKSFVAPETGTLHLGVNDYNPLKNQGEFYVQLTEPEAVQPVKLEKVVPGIVAEGTPAPGCEVIVFYVDGLRPDVVEEMAAMGHLPNIRSLFVDGGTWMSRCFTAFPSDTITSNGTMWTGCFSDRHGLKGQVTFSRESLTSYSHLDPLGPQRSGRLLSPQGLEKAWLESEGASRSWLQGEKDRNTWLSKQTSQVPPLYDYLREENQDWGTGVLPIMAEVPPVLWTRSLTRHLPYFRSHRAWEYIDDANAHYAVRHLVGGSQPVKVVWLPETDSCSHKHSRGQFGMTRRTIAQADHLIGQVVSAVKTHGRFDKTYFLLVSDHGHHGGKDSFLQRYDLANEFFFEQRQVTKSGEWVGGGLGLSVRQHRFQNRHPEDGERQFVFIDGEADGAARVFLPKGTYQSEDWSGPNRPGDLLDYPIKKKGESVNLIERLTKASAIDSRGEPTPVVDLVLVKLNDNSMLIATSDRGYAVVSRERDASRGWMYRYQVVADLHRNERGEIEYREDPHALVDPLRLYEFLPSRLLEYAHDEQTWLRMTAQTIYPDSVVALTRHMLWQSNIESRESEYAPDLVVTARSGWYFDRSNSPGTMHGYPLADAMRATMFVSGPNIRQGARIDEPCRLVDLTPTLLEMAGYARSGRDFDGKPMRLIYRNGQSDDSLPLATVPDELADSLTIEGLPFPDDRTVAYTIDPVVTRSVYWDELEIKTETDAVYTPTEEYRHLPGSINDADSPWDLNNMAYNLISIPDWNLYRMFDDVISPISGRKDFLVQHVESLDLNARTAAPEWVADGLNSLAVGDVTLNDYNITSQGNLARIDRTIDWVQGRSLALDETIADSLEMDVNPVSKGVHKGIDLTQYAFWDVYRFTQRIVIKLVDETLLNGAEDQTDEAMNSWDLPAERQVDE